MAGSTKQFTDANFDSDVLKSEIPVLVDFWAPWCGPCVSIAPMLDELSAEYEGKISVGKMNVDENPNTPATYGVRSIPYLVLIKNGEVVDSIMGAQPKAQFKAILDKHSSIA